MTATHPQIKSRTHDDSADTGRDFNPPRPRDVFARALQHLHRLCRGVLDGQPDAMENDNLLALANAAIAVALHRRSTRTQVQALDALLDELEKKPEHRYSRDPDAQDHPPDPYDQRDYNEH